MAQRIKTNIKFYKGLENVADRLYGFVTKTNGSWKGCRETESKKKIVFVDPSIAKDIIPNMLYSCTLMPMRSETGFIAKSATILRFPATIKTICRKNVFVVRITFGNKEIIYDPSSKEKRKNDIQVIAQLLRGRNDLENAIATAEDFIDNAFMVRKLYEQSQGNV